MVSVLAFYYDNASSNVAEIYSDILKNKQAVAHLIKNHVVISTVSLARGGGIHLNRYLSTPLEFYFMACNSFGSPLT